MNSIPPVHKFGSRKEWENYIWEGLIREIKEAHSLQDVEKIIDMLITAHEKKQIVNRAAAISLLKQRKTYREIGEMLWLSPTTISSIRKSAQSGRGYMSRYARQKVSGENKKKISVFPRERGVGVIQPHGKLFYPQRRRR